MELTVHTCLALHGPVVPLFLRVPGVLLVVSRGVCVDGAERAGDTRWCGAGTGQVRRGAGWQLAARVAAVASWVAGPMSVCLAHKPAQAVVCQWSVVTGLCSAGRPSFGGAGPRRGQVIAQSDPLLAMPLLSATHSASSPVVARLIVFLLLVRVSHRRPPHCLLLLLLFLTQPFSFFPVTPFLFLRPFGTRHSFRVQYIHSIRPPYRTKNPTFQTTSLAKQPPFFSTRPGLLQRPHVPCTELIARHYIRIPRLNTLFYTICSKPTLQHCLPISN